MIEFLIFLALTIPFILGIVALSAINRMKKEMRIQRSYLTRLQAYFKSQNITLPSQEEVSSILGQKQNEVSSPQKSPLPVVQEDPESPPQRQTQRESPKLEEVKIQQKVVSTTKEPEPKRAKRPETRGWMDFVFSNLLGVAGGLIVLVGLIYLSFLGAFYLTPAFRSAALGALGLTLSLLPFFLPKKVFFENLRGWLMGIGGAILLFVALGSSSLPGLRWINNSPFLGYTLVFLAMGFNLALAYLAKKSLMVALHGLFCFLALLFAPFELLTLITALVLGLLLGLISLQRKNIFTMMLTAIFSLLYFFIWSQSSELSGSPLPLFLVFSFLHYFYFFLFSKEFLVLQRTRAMKALSLILGGGFALGALLLGGTAFTYTILFGLSALFFGAQLFGYRKKLRPFLFHLQSLLVFFSAFASLISWFLWQEESILPILVLGGLGLIWALGVYKQLLPKKLLFLGVLTEVLGWSWIFLKGMDGLFSQSPFPSLGIEVLWLLLPLGATILRGLLLKSSESGEKELRFFSLFNALGWLLLLFVYGAHASSTIPFAFVLGLGLLGLGMSFLEEKGWVKNQNTLLALGLVALFLGIFSGEQVYTLSNGALWSILALGFALFVLLRPKTKAFPEDLGFTAPLWLSLGALALPFFAFSRELPFIVGPLWLLAFPLMNLALPKLEKAPLNRQSQFIHSLALFLPLGLFWIHHFLVTLQSGQILALPLGSSLPPLVLSHTALSALAGLGAMLWVYLDRKEKKPQSTARILLFFFLIFLVSLRVEISHQNIALALGLFALLFWLVGKNGKIHFRPFQNYSLWLFWLSVVFFATMTSSLRYQAFLQAAPTLLQVLATLSLQVLYLVLQLSQSSRERPTASTWVEKWEKKVQTHLAPLLVLPFFFSLGLYLFWALDGTVLTLGWVLQCLGLFILGLSLRRPLFHYLSLILISITVIRLVFFDLGTTAEFFKVLVLIFSGAVLILMSVLYQRFNPKPALSKEEQEIEQ